MYNNDEKSEKSDIFWHYQRFNRFSYEVGGIPKPVSLKGWACYGIILLSPLIMVIFNDPTIDTAFIVAIIFGVILISVLKSNYRDIVKEYRKDLKNENER